MSKATLFDSRIKKYAYCKPPEICRDLGTSALGLSKEQVDTMRERYGKNSFQERKTDTTIQRLRRAFINPFHVILFILGIVSLVTDVFMASNFARNATTALIIFSMIVISGIIRLIQELRAKSTAAQLDRLIHEKVTVRRNGELREIPGEELVVGDLVLFSAGDRVPADIRLTKVTDLFISQAAITGESAILEKSCRTLCYKEQEPMVERVLAITGCSDKKSVRTMTQIVRSIAQYCQDNLITDGCCGVRELIAWVQSFMVCGDIQEAAHYTILSSVTADSESRIEIEGSCLDTVLAS